MKTSRPIAPIDGDAAIWKSDRSLREPLVVFLHGYGGNEQDWVPYFDLLPEDVGGVCLRAPVPRGDRWAWVDQHQEGVGLGAFTAAARGVVEWVETLGTRRIALVGWSQGAAMAIHVARQRPNRFDAVAMGGGFVWERRAHTALETRGLPVWFGIGSEDDVIPKPMVESARRFLEATTEAELRTYAGERHELSAGIAADAIAFALRHLDRN